MRAAMVKLYEQRASLVLCEQRDERSFMEHAQKIAPSVDSKYLRSLSRLSQVKGITRPELFIENILQILAGNRSYALEQEFFSTLPEEDTLDWKLFQSEFLAFFKLKYENSEIKRVLNLIRRFSLSASNRIDRAYIHAFIESSNSQIHHRFFNSIIHKLVMKKHYKKFNRNPLQSIDVNVERQLSFKVSTERTNALRSKVFVHALSKYNSAYTASVARGAFNIIKNPHKYADPYIHRGIVMYLLKTEESLNKTLSEFVKRWKNNKNSVKINEIGFKSLKLSLDFPVYKHMHSVFRDIVSYKNPLETVMHISRPKWKLQIKRIFRKWKTFWENSNEMWAIQERIQGSSKELSHMIIETGLARLKNLFFLKKSNTKSQCWGTWKNVPRRKKTKKSPVSIVKVHHGIEKLCLVNRTILRRANLIKKRNALKKWKINIHPKILNLGLYK